MIRQMVSLPGTVKQVMRTRIRSPRPVFELLMFLLVAVVGWAAFEAWQVFQTLEDSRETERRPPPMKDVNRQHRDDSNKLALYQIRDDYLGFDRRARPAVESMHDMLKQYARAGDSNSWREFEQARKVVESWIVRVEEDAFNRPLDDLEKWVKERTVSVNGFELPKLDVLRQLQKFKHHYEEYTNAADSLRVIKSTPTRTAPVPAPRRSDVAPPVRSSSANVRDQATNAQLERAEAAVLALFDVTDHAQADSTMVQWLIESSPVVPELPVLAEPEPLWMFKKQFVRVLYILSVGLIGLCVFTGVAIYRRVYVAPLHLRLVVRETIIEQQEKLHHFEQLAALLAHEIKQPLAAINAWVWVLQRSLTEGTSEHKGAVLIRNEMNRIDGIMKNFLRLSQPVDPKLVPMRPDPVLREVVDLMGPKLEAKSISIVIDSVVDVPFKADPQQFKQVILNIVQNAAEAIGQDGQIKLRARRDRVMLRGERTNVLVFEVEDNGPGIPVEVQERLFDPFYSTKESGTGLGLAIAARIIDKHDGALKFETEPGRGTTFSIILPISK